HGPRGEPVTRDRGAVLAAASRQRDGQLHQGRAAAAGAHSTRETRPRPPAPPRDERGGDDHDEVAGAWPPPPFHCRRSRAPTATRTATSSRCRGLSLPSASCSTRAMLTSPFPT